jgi:hypothetical protein
MTMKREIHLTLDDSSKIKLEDMAVNYAKQSLFYENTQEVAQTISPEILSVLPEEITSKIQAMLTEDGPDLLSVSNLPIDKNPPLEGELEDRINKKTRLSEYCLVGLSSLLKGKLQSEESSHQPGLIHQITPVQTFEHESSGRGRQGLPFHVENVFVKSPPSFLCLFCIEGEKNVGTEYIFLQDIMDYLDESTIEELKRPIYKIWTGDGFNKKVLEDSSVIEDMGNNWTLGRLYEEDRIFTDDEKGKLAVEKLHEAIINARDYNHNSVNLGPGTLLIFRNGTGKGRFGGIMHGRKGNIGDKKSKTAMRWLQRLCVEIDYK